MLNKKCSFYANKTPLSSFGKQPKSQKNLIQTEDRHSLYKL